MLANDFSIDLMVDLIRAGLASAAPERIAAGTRKMEVTRIRITETGQQVLKTATRP